MGLILFYFRLNTKLEARELEIKDLVVDLSDGVSACRRWNLHNAGLWRTDNLSPRCR